MGPSFQGTQMTAVVLLAALASNSCARVAVSTRLCAGSVALLDPVGLTGQINCGGVASCGIADRGQQRL